MKDLRLINKAMLSVKGHVRELLTLIKDNPDLPIVAYVDGDIVADDSSCRWIGSIGKSHIIEYVAVEMYRGMPEMIYRDDTEEYETYLLENTELSEEAVKEHINNLSWVKAIAVNIDLPELQEV